MDKEDMKVEIQTMTSDQAIQAIKNFRMSNCTHREPKHLWCHGDCFEYTGITSRFVEACMKGIKVRNFNFIPMLYDETDFMGFHTGIMTDHPDWKERLPQMARFGREWQSLIRNYKELEQCYENNEINKLKEIMSCMRKNTSRLYSYEINDIENIVLKENLIMCSLVPREAGDEFDICHHGITNKIPMNKQYPSLNCATYNTKGEICGYHTVELFEPMKEETSSKERLKEISKREHNICNTFNSSRYNNREAMVDVCNRYEDGEVILDSEILTDMNENIYEPREYYDEECEYIQKLVEKTCDIIDFTDEYNKENVVQFEEQYKNIRSLKNRCDIVLSMHKRYNYEINPLIAGIQKKCETVIELLNELYFDEYKDFMQMHKNAEKGVLEMPKVFSNVTYHYVPHYIMYDDLNKEYNDNFKMYSVEVSDENQYNGSWGIQTCIISITENHVLHQNNHPDDFQVEFNGVMWSISDEVKLNTYYEEGIMNAY